MKPGPGVDVDTSFKFLLAVETNEGYNQVGYIQYESDGDLTEWRDLTGTLTVPMSATKLTVYVNSTDKTTEVEISYEPISWGKLRLFLQFTELFGSGSF